MNARFAALLFAISLLYCPLAGAQAPSTSPAPNQAATTTHEVGLTPTRLIDQKDVRVTRVLIDAGAVRRVHQHDDVKFHIFIPVSGKLELTIGDHPPMVVEPGQAYYLAKGTPHGFRNVGTTQAMLMEVFVF